LPKSERQQQSTKAYQDRAYSKCSIQIRKDWNFRDTVKLAAEACGESVNGFMVKAIRDKVEAAGFSFPVPVLPDKHETE